LRFVGGIGGGKKKTLSPSTVKAGKMAEFIADGVGGRDTKRKAV